MKKTAEIHHRAGVPQMRCKLLTLLIAGCFGSGAADANPVGAQVINGQVSFANQNNTLTVTNSPGSIINWQSFSINQGETTRFIQQSASSAVLNRITGQDPSQILGALQSNGRVFLINPNGILFGAGAQVDVNGLVASTLNMSNADFLAGKLNFNAGDSAGTLRNQGAITTPNGGQVYLIAPSVENSGIITAPNGQVLLAAGHSVQLVDSADPDLQVVVSAPDDQALNLGKIVTQGGRIGIYGALISQSGIVSADSAVVGENGKIVFKASREIDVAAGSSTSANGIDGGSVTLRSDGSTLVHGSIAARGSQGKGGQIQVLGQQVGVLDQADIDASGATGGGTVLVGGDYQGKGSVQNAQVTYTGQQATIKADATGYGNGGKVIVWADDTTRTYAHISVRGGEQGGDGGFVETSGKKFLDVGTAFPDVRAPKGKAGSWLLDPEDITIDAAAGSNIGPGPTFTPAGSGSSILNVATLTAYLESNGNATVDTTNPNIANGFGLGNITVNAAIAPNMSSAGWLSLRANNQININAPISASGYALDVKLQADFTSQDGNAINLNSSINSNGGMISMNGGGMMYLNGALNSGGGNIRIFGTSLTTTASGTIDAGNGDVDLRADQMTLNSTVKAATASLRPITSGRAITVGSTTCYTDPCLSIINLYNIIAPTIGIGHDPQDGGGGSDPVGSIYVAGITHSNSNALTDRNDITTRIGLLSSADVTQSGAIDVHDLGVMSGGNVTLTNSGNKVSALAGAISGGGGFAFTDAQGFDVGDLTGKDYGVHGVSTSGGDISLTTGSGDIGIGANVDAVGGNVTLQAAGALVKKGGVVVGNELVAKAQSGIALDTKVHALTALNNDNASGSDIVVNNAGMLALNDVKQLGSTNGNIAISNQGALKVTSLHDVHTVGGSISLIAHSPLTVDGSVTSTSGAIGLEAGASNSGGDNLTINGSVATAGNVTLKAGDAITINGSVSGASVTKQENGNVGTTVDQCSANPSLAGCTTINSASTTVVSTTTAITATTTPITSITSPVTQQSTDTTASSSSDAKTDDGTGDKKEDRKDTAGQKDNGEKQNEHVKKTYCN